MTPHLRVVCLYDPPPPHLRVVCVLCSTPQYLNPNGTFESLGPTQALPGRIMTTTFICCTPCATLQERYYFYDVILFQTDNGSF